MRAVSFDELAQWVKDNKHHTWYVGEGGGFDATVAREKSAKGGTLSMKYIYFCLDTRDMKIFRLTVSGFAPLDKPFDFRDEGEGSILDALSKWLDERVEKLNAQKEKDTKAEKAGRHR